MDNVEKWRRTDELFQEALDLPAAEREAFLRQACGADTLVFDEVMDLLQATEHESILDTPLIHTSGGFLQDALQHIHREPHRTDALFPGDKVGPYEITEEIGRGGMAVVYQAERADGLFAKTVALKVIKRGTDTDEVVRRFEHERRILGSLDHPNIAKVFDGGVTADGRPYFVMEYVKGLPITDYCNENKLDIPARLALFAKVARAVQHAHRNLVVHRDLKPSNILVGEDGKVQLLDFGVAKLLRPEPNEEFGVITSTGRLFLTPQYASPELVTGERLSTASDIYQLGLILYETLTGQPPYLVSSAVRAEVEKLVCYRQPPRPSTVVDRSADGDNMASFFGEPNGYRLSRTLRGDLDNMVMKALSKEPSGRYASAQRLAEDIDRYLRGMPVLARDATWPYRSRKFLWRNRWFVAASLLVALTIGGYVATYALQSVRISTEAQRARLEAEKSDQVAGFMMSLLESYGPNVATGGLVQVDEVLQDGLLKAESELANQPDVQQQIYFMIGDILDDYGQYELAELTLRRSVELARTVHGRFSPVVAEANALLGWILFKAGSREEGQRILEDALELQQNVLPPDDVRLATTLGYLGSVAHENANYPRAESLFREALWLQERAFGATDISVSETLSNLGYVLQLQSKDNDAEVAYRRALEIATSLYDGDHTEVADALQGMGVFLIAQGDLAEAKPYLINALDMRLRLFGDIHPQIANNLSNLGILAGEQGNIEQSLEYFNESLGMRLRLFGENHITVANSKHQIGWLHYESGEFDKAEELLTSAYTSYVNLLGSQHDFVGAIQNKLALCLSALERYSEAEAVFNLALANRSDRHGENSNAHSMVLNNLGVLKTQIGRLEEAEIDLRSALSVREELLGTGHWRTHQSYRDLGRNLALQSRFDEAFSLLEKALYGFIESRGAADAFTSETLQYLSDLSRASGQSNRVRSYQARLANQD